MQASSRGKAMAAGEEPAEETGNYRYPNPNFHEDLRRFMVDERGDAMRRFIESIAKVIELSILSAGLYAAGSVRHSKSLEWIGVAIAGLTGLYVFSFFERHFRGSGRLSFGRRLVLACLFAVLCFGLIGLHGVIRTFVEDTIHHAH